MSFVGDVFSSLTGGGAGALDSLPADQISDDNIAIVFANGEFYPYKADTASGLAESAPDVIAPDLATAGGAAYTGDTRWILQRVPQTNTVPIGTIVAWSGVYMTGPNNDGVVDVLGNDVAAANTRLNPDGWYVCDGSELNVAGSAKYDGSGRYLPLLVDSRFILGSGSAGVMGGSNTTTHVHRITKTLQTNATTLTISQIPPHLHDVPRLAYVWGLGTAADHGWKYDNGSPYTSTETSYTGGGDSHTHWLTMDFDSGSPSNTNNMPKYFTTLYIEKVL